MSVSVIIVAAGRGDRFGMNLPKAFFPLAGRPLIAHALKTFSEVGEVSEIIAVVRLEMMGESWKSNLGNGDFNKLKSVIAGGATRADSAWAGLQEISKNQEIVLVHDAARPLVKRQVIENVIEGARRWGAAIPGIKIKPTVKEINAEGFVIKTHDRDKLWEAQTPQGFRVDVLKRAFEKAGDEKVHATDESLLMERSGMPVKMVEGDPTNIKITTQEDLKWAELFLQEGKN